MEKSKELTFPPRLEILQTAQDSHFPNPLLRRSVLLFRFARQINAWVNGHNRRCLSLRGNENPFEFDPLYRPATRGLHYGQELGSTNRPDTFEQTKPPATEILLAIVRRTIQSPQPRLRRRRDILAHKPKPRNSGYGWMRKTGQVSGFLQVDPYLRTCSFTWL